MKIENCSRRRLKRLGHLRSNSAAGGLSHRSLLLAHCVDPGIDRQGCYRTITGHPAKSRSSLPYGVGQDRGPSQIYRLERVAGPAIIGQWRNNSAHFHRPWRATSVRSVPDTWVTVSSDHMGNTSGRVLSWLAAAKPLARYGAMGARFARTPTCDERNLMVHAVSRARPLAVRAHMSASGSRGHTSNRARSPPPRRCRRRQNIVLSASASIRQRPSAAKAKRVSVIVCQPVTIAPKHCSEDALAMPRQERSVCRHAARRWPLRCWRRSGTRCHRATSGA